MKIIPVLDVMGGVVVRAVGGRRAEYRPIQSRLTTSTDPIEVAKRLLDVTGSQELYVADLDAILNPDHHSELAATLADAFPKTRILYDRGIRTPDDVRKIPMVRLQKRIPWLGWVYGTEYRSNLHPILATETTESFETVTEYMRAHMGTGVVSVDHRDGRWLGHVAVSRDLGLTDDSFTADVAEAFAMHVGACAIILLDLAKVGEQCGSLSTKLVRSVCGRFSSIGDEVYVGGGIRSWDDIHRLEDAGAAGVLVASALHDGTLVVPEAPGVSRRSTPG